MPRFYHFIRRISRHQKNKRCLGQVGWSSCLEPDMMLAASRSERRQRR